MCSKSTVRGKSFLCTMHREQRSMQFSKRECASGPRKRAVSRRSADLRSTSTAADHPASAFRTTRFASGAFQSNLTKCVWAFVSSFHLLESNSAQCTEYLICTKLNNLIVTIRTSYIRTSMTWRLADLPIASQHVHSKRQGWLLHARQHACPRKPVSIASTHA